MYRKEDVLKKLNEDNYYIDKLTQFMKQKTAQFSLMTSVFSNLKKGLA